MNIERVRNKFRTTFTVERLFYSKILRGLTFEFWALSLLNTQLKKYG